MTCNSFTKTFLSKMVPSIISLTLFTLRRAFNTCRMIIPTPVALLCLRLVVVLWSGLRGSSSLCIFGRVLRWAASTCLPSVLVVRMADCMDLLARHGLQLFLRIPVWLSYLYCLFYCQFLTFCDELFPHLLWRCPENDPTPNHLVLTVNVIAVLCKYS